MKETFERNDCGRAEQLIGYLYGEAGAAERADFERHLHDCSACRDEMAAFTHVRTSVADFRAELLQAAPTVSLEEFAASAKQTTAHTTQSSPRAASESQSSPPNESASPHATLAGFAPPANDPRASASAAWAALREFFRLSPAWLRVSTVAATLGLCALALLAVVNAEVSFGSEGFAFSTGVRPTPTAPAVPPAQSGELTALQAQLNNVSAERDAAVRELEETRAQLDDSRAANLVAAEFEAEPLAERGPSAQPDERRQRRAPSASSKSGKPPRAARRASDEEDLPRLLDLLGDAN